jgi:hypothetical protein
MTFAEGVLRLVRTGSRTGPLLEPAAGPAEGEPVLAPGDPALLPGDPALLPAALAEAATSSAAELSAVEPGFCDIEAAFALVEAGLASRIVLAGFRSWPGLLWRAYQLAEGTDVLILPTVVRSGGLVDIVITRDRPVDG